MSTAVPGAAVARRRPMTAAVVAAGLVAVLSAVVGGTLSGALADGGLLDAGLAVRWGLPAMKVVAEVTGAVTIGALVLGAFVLPRGTGRTSSDGRAFPAVTVVAAVAAGIWAVANVAYLVLTYADIAGSAVTGPTFGAELGLFVTAVTMGRTLLGITVVAAITCVVALLVTRPQGALLTALLAASTLAMQASTGHVVDANHDLAISSLFVHLGGAAVWIGGLVALALVAHRLGPDLPAAVARYSTIAAWAFVAVAISGTVNGALRLGGTEELRSPYGLLLLAKVFLFAVLGVIGAAHRRGVVGRLEGQGVPRLFWRLVLVELMVMGAVSGIAVALGTTSAPSSALAGDEPTPAELVTGHVLPPAPTPELWLTSFRWDLLAALGSLAGVVVYLRWVRRLAARGDSWPVGRTVCLVTAMAVLAWTTSGGPNVYGHVLFSAHMVQHMLLVMVVPVLLALSAPVTLAARALPVRTDGSWGPRELLLGLVHSRWAQVLAHPVVAAVNFAASMFVFYFTDLFELTLETYVGHLLMVAHFSLAGYLFVNALVGVDPGPRRQGHPIRLLLLFAVMAFHAFFGLALVSSEALLVPEWFGLTGRPWGPSALADQRVGGSIAWGVSELPMLALAIALAVSWTRDDERTARRRDRAADRDGDAELAEYNAMLARRGAGRSQ